MLDMARKDILPAMSEYSAELARDAAAKTSFDPDADCTYEKENIKNLCALIGACNRAVKKTEQDLISAKSITDGAELAEFYKSTIIDDMKAIRFRLTKWKLSRQVKSGLILHTASCFSE